MVKMSAAECFAMLEPIFVSFLLPLLPSLLAPTVPANHPPHHGTPVCPSHDALAAPANTTRGANLSHHHRGATLSPPGPACWRGLHFFGSTLPLSRHCTHLSYLPSPHTVPTRHISDNETHPHLFFLLQPHQSPRDSETQPRLRKCMRI